MQQAAEETGAATKVQLTTNSRDQDARPNVEAATMRRVNRRLLPLLLLLYVVCFIDRTNVGIAALQMNRDLGFSAAVYGLGSGIFFLGYALFEVPSNLVLARVGARWWIGRIAVTWGLITALMMLVRSPASFYVLRFLLGVAEAGFFPGALYYLSHWFPERYRARSVARLALGVPLASAIGGALGTSILRLDGALGLAGWQWLFVLEGLPAVVLGVIAVVFLTDRPRDAAWLSAEQRAWLSAEIETEERAGIHRGTVSIRRLLGDRFFRWVSGVYFLYAVPSFALALWMPTMLREAGGLSTDAVGVAVSVTGVVSVVVMLLTGANSDRTGERAWHAAGPCLFAAAGFALAALGKPAAAVAGLGLAFVGGSTFLPIFWTVPAARLRGPAAAGGIALLNSVGILGGFVGPSSVGVLRDATGGFVTALLVFTLAMLIVGAGTLALYGRAATDTRAQRTVDESRASTTDDPLAIVS